MPREELLQLVGGALRRSVTYLDRPGALASAGALLADLKSQGLSLHRRRVAPDEELLQLVAAALRRAIPYLQEGWALPAADTLLRDLMSQGLSLRRRRPAAGVNPVTR